jgi:hypothetical protein
MALNFKFVGGQLVTVDLCGENCFVRSLPAGNRKGLKRNKEIRKRRRKEERKKERYMDSCFMYM